MRMRNYSPANVLLQSIIQGSKIKFTANFSQAGNILAIAFCMQQFAASYSD